MNLPLAVSTGDPAGIGPVVSARAATRLAGEATCVLFGDGPRLQELVRVEGGVPHTLEAHAAWSLPGGVVGVVHVADWTDACIAVHGPSAEGGVAQLRAIDGAFDAVRAGKASALVTAPASKAAVVMGGVRFAGHTEYLAERAGLANDEVTMLFLGPRLRTALVTTHLPVRLAADAVTAARVARATRHLAEAVTRMATPDAAPRIVVAGLNPHAGEGGLLGNEDAESIAPGVEAAVREARDAGLRVTIEGPIPAETAFRWAAEGRVAGVVAMLHDQATIASKVLDWGHAVNVTWGLPFVRTSVDHGVAYDAARAGTGDAEGMEAAIRMAAELTSGARG
ncbi:MAG: 4-hydroxythreonine-4-phosphate dehydrogenase PdxA [Polyangiales bacterium]